MDKQKKKLIVKYALYIRYLALFVTKKNIWTAFINGKFSKMFNVLQIILDYVFEYISYLIRHIIYIFHNIYVIFYNIYRNMILIISIIFH